LRRDDQRFEGLQVLFLKICPMFVDPGLIAAGEKLAAIEFNRPFITGDSLLSVTPPPRLDGFGNQPIELFDIDRIRVFGIEEVMIIAIEEEIILQRLVTVKRFADV
jgi:hypothetical protein